MPLETEIADIQTAEQAINAAVAFVGTIPRRIENAINAFRNANPSIDTTALDAELATLKADTDQLNNAIAPLATDPNAPAG